MADILLNVEGMKVYYPVKGDFGKGREFVKAVDGVSFEVRKGEVFGIVGESGCGKSTLGRGICKLETPTAGKIVLSGEDISSYGRKQMRSVRKKVQMVFQDPYASLNPRMSIFDIIAEPLIIHGLTKSKKELEDRVMELLRKVGLDDYHANRYPHEFSGGQRQRVALARALVMKPRILLLDEPLSALDAQIRKHLRQQIRQIQRELNLTTIFVTHDQEEAMLMSDRIFLMNKGEIVQSDTAENIYTQPANEFVARFMGHYNLVSAHNANSLLGLNLSGIVAIRPESIYVREAGRQYGEHISHPVSGTIRDSQLLGNIIRYQVDTGLGALTVDLLNRSSERLFEQGTQLELMFNKNEIRALAPSVN